MSLVSDGKLMMSTEKMFYIEFTFLITIFRWISSKKCSPLALLVVPSKLPSDLFRLASDTKLIFLSRFPVPTDPINLLIQTRELSELLTEKFGCIALKTR